VLSFEERELGRRMQGLAAMVVVPTAPTLAARGRFSLLPVLASVIVAVVVLVSVGQLATRESNTLSPRSPAPVVTSTPTPSPSPMATPTQSHRATPYAGLPSSTFLATPGVTHTITGTITELGPQGQQPVPGARIDVYLHASNRSGHWMSDVTETDGRYELWGIPSGAIAVLYSGKGNSLEYVQPCVHEVTVTSDVSLDMEIVPRSAGGAAANAAARRGPGTFLTGVVYGQLPDGKRAPLPDATVWLDGDMTPLAATTITDADGRYVLCGIPRGPHEFAATAEGGYDNVKNPQRSIDVAGDMTLDLELRR
jgi:carboxypeptidase family protein